MLLRKNKRYLYEEIEKSLTLIQKKILWLQENENINTILLAGHNNKSIQSLSERLFQKLTENHDKSFLLINLNDNTLQPENIDWDHDLIIAYCDNLITCPQLYSFSNYVDTSLIMVEAGHTSRNIIKEMIQSLKDINISVCGCILHNYKEKIPSFLNRILN